MIILRDHFFNSHLDTKLLFSRFGIGITNEHWLDFRLRLFKALTLPSVDKAFNGLWFIFIDSDAPDSFKRHIRNINFENSKPLIIEIDFMFQYIIIVNSIIKLAIKKFGHVLASRIDDDDAINPKTWRIFEEISVNKTDCIVTFPRGLEMLSQEMILSKYNHPFHSMNTFYKISDPGFSGLLTMNHSRIKEYSDTKNIETILIKELEPSFLYSRHKHTDSAFPGIKSKILSDKKSRKIVSSEYDVFCIDRDAFNDFRLFAKTAKSIKSSKVWLYEYERSELAFGLYKKIELLKSQSIDFSKKELFHEKSNG